MISQNTSGVGALSKENLILLNEALEFLSSKQRTIVRMRFWENMSIQEIASRIGVPWDTTDRMIEETLNHLRYRIIQLSHAREERELMNLFTPLAA